MIVFGWRGFPQYAARCVGAFVKTCSEPVVVVASKPVVPIKGMEQLCGCPVYWVDRVHDFSSQVSAFKPSEVTNYIVSGWGIPALDDLREQVHKNNGQVITFFDHCYKCGFTTALKGLRFRLIYRRKFDRFFVPGKSGRRLLRSWGVADQLIEEGMYAADASLFRNTIPLAQRPKKIICVAQYIGWKNARRLILGFQKVDNPEWSLEFYGSGPLKGELTELAKGSPNISINDFLQPEQLCAKYNEARFFCLPSESENWGLVVHEAALSGCGLLLSKYVGSAADLLEEGKNGLSFDPFDVESIALALKSAMALTDAQLEEMGRVNAQMANAASLDKFVDAVSRLTAKT